MAEADPPSAPAAAFLRDLQQAFAAARQVAGEVRRSFRLGDARVTLSFAGPALASVLTPALEHLEVSADAGDLEVALFDSESTGVPPPDLPWSAADVQAAGMVAGYCDARFRTILQVAVGLVVVLDRVRGRAVCWVRSAGQLPMPERAAPLRRLLSEWMADRGHVLVHAGAVGNPGGGVLLAGQSGAGKSTTALRCLTSPVRYAGDDYCLVRPGPEPRVFSLYSSGKTYPADGERLAFLGVAATEAAPDDLKTLYLLNRTFGDRLIEDFPLRAVLAPQVVSAPRSRIVPASGVAVLTALAATTILLSPHRAGATLPQLSALVRSLPTYRLELGEDASDVPQLIADLLACHGAGL